MKSLYKFAFTGVALLTTLVAATRPCAATEAGNSTAPWLRPNYRYDMSVYLSPAFSAGWGDGIEAISPTGDVDYLVVTCGADIMDKITVSYTHANGDIDMQVYTLGGALVGGSYGVTGSESVSVLAQSRNAFVLKVYGYAGAVNQYGLGIFCKGY